MTIAQVRKELGKGPFLLECVRVADVGRMLGKSATTVYSYIRKGTLQSVLVGFGEAVPLCEVAKYMDITLEQMEKLVRELLVEVCLAWLEPIAYSKAELVEVWI